MKWRPDGMRESLGPPKGTQVAKIIDADDGLSKKSGKSMTTLTFEIIQGPHEGKRLWDYFVHGNPSSIRKMLSLLAATGLDRRTEVDNCDFIGCCVRVNLEVESYQGNKRSRIKSYSPARP